mmetsp:Transcript_843/g.1359  ORF Transcript_843/g.1359 Transcript_843/m.1359 type:complete len:92 (+) Transcript_843:193-468(+)
MMDAVMNMRMLLREPSLSAAFCMRVDLDGPRVRAWLKSSAAPPRSRNTCFLEWIVVQMDTRTHQTTHCGTAPPARLGDAFSTGGRRMLSEG